MLDRLGVGPRLLAMAIKVPQWQIRDRHAGVIGDFDLAMLARDTPFPHRTHCEQHKLTPVLLDLLAQWPEARVRFSARFLAARQSADEVIVEIATPGGTDRLGAAYLVGADGGRSAVRK